MWSVRGRSLPPPPSQRWRFEEQTNDRKHSGAELGEEDEDRQRGGKKLVLTSRPADVRRRNEEQKHPENKKKE